MDIESLRDVEDEALRVQKLYEIFHERTRLHRSQAAQVEFLTTVRCLERYLAPQSRVLDVGAGAGDYSLYLAERGHDVSAIELSPRNVEDFRARIPEGAAIDLRQGNALDLSAYAEESFDVVLLFGPLYHLERREDQLCCIREALRVLKPGGLLFSAFISNDMVILTELAYRPHFFSEGTHDPETFRVENFPFVFHRPEDCRALFSDCGVLPVAEVAADGLSELMEDRINALDEADFAAYLRYHFSCCERPELFGHSNHLLFIGRKI